MRNFHEKAGALAIVLVTAGLFAGCSEEDGLGPVAAGPEAVELSVLRGQLLRQVDRFGLPGVNTAFTDASALKDEYNLGTPATDEAQFLERLSEVMQARYGLSVAGANGLADFVLPDVQGLGDLSGFPNGRKLDDDVIDTVLSLIFGVFGPAVPALQSDNVDANDVPFLGTFPYLAGPHVF